MEEQLQIEQGIRLKQLIKALILNQSSFARALGMTQPNISRMISGENNISAEVLRRITNTHKTINLHWLLTGEGEMCLAPEGKPSLTPPAPAVPLLWRASWVGYRLREEPPHKAGE